ncbi:Dna2/Cas4 domain-containing protein [Streptomyces sp. NPDC059155]|uniref:Dna2/Cas4 domain-containing protein n=1 Tax=unclassified Streptomyces TaxID=2593676 RepID=UPI0036B27EE9
MRRTTDVVWDDEARAEAQDTEAKAQAIIATSVAPDRLLRGKCRGCSYLDYCWGDTDVRRRPHLLADPTPEAGLGRHQPWRVCNTPERLMSACPGTPKPEPASICTAAPSRPSVTLVIVRWLISEP